MATDHNCEAIVDSHPELILVSESPVTWKGFLIVPHLLHSAGSARCSRVKLKLVMPNYPSFYNAQISFGRHIAFLRNRKFSRKVKESMESAQTVLLFLKQLQSLIVSLLIGILVCYSLIIMLRLYILQIG